MSDTELLEALIKKTGIMPFEMQGKIIFAGVGLEKIKQLELREKKLRAFLESNVIWVPESGSDTPETQLSWEARELLTELYSEEGESK